MQGYERALENTRSPRGYNSTAMTSYGKAVKAMANTYTQLIIHIVFAVRMRHRFLAESSLERAHKYIAAVIREKGHKPIIVGGVEDHVHLLIGLKPVEAISDLVRDVKANSSAFVRRERLAPSGFSWQQGYGAFSHSRRELPSVYRYIQDQRQHHVKRSFRQEYEALLKDFGVHYDSQFIFE